VLRTMETWKRHPSLANVYVEQLSYLFSVEDIQLSDDPLRAQIEAAARGGIEGFSLETGVFKIIGSEQPVIFASHQD